MSKKVLGYTFVLVLSILLALTGCSKDNGNGDSKSNDTAENGNQEEKNNSSPENNSGNTENNSEVNQEENEEDTNDEQENAEERGKSKWGEDEEGLGIGDTGNLHNNFSKTKITLDSVKAVDDKEYDEAYYGQYVIANMTVKNIGDDPVDPDDLFDSTELAVEGQHGGEMWDEYEELSEGWPEKIDVNEEASGPLVFDIEESDFYELKVNFHFDSVSNKISFKFTGDEVD